MSGLIEHAERELRALPGKRDTTRTMLERDIVALVALFDAQRHSGASAAFVTRALEKLLRWKGLDPAHEAQAFGEHLILQAAVDSALIGRTTMACEALEEAAAWHDRQEKALSKQPPGGDREWRRNEHREQAELLRAAVVTRIPAVAPSPTGTDAGLEARDRT